MRKEAVSGVLAAVLLAGLGCQAFKPAGQRRQLVVASNLIMPDLPVPQGFEIDHPRSYFVNPSKGTRIVFVTYKGRGNALELMEFFRQNMSISGWTLEEESGDFGSYVLFFNNVKEDLEIKIKPGRMSTEIVMSVKPTSGKSQRREKKRPPAANPVEMPGSKSNIAVLNLHNPRGDRTRDNG